MQANEYPEKYAKAAEETAELAEEMMTVAKTQSTKEKNGDENNARISEAA